MIFRAFQADLDVAAVWGGITGTLANQTDLNTALGLKAPLASPTFTTSITTPLVIGTSTQLALRPTTNAVTAIQLQNAAGTNILNVDTTNSRVGIGNAAPTTALDVTGSILASATVTGSNVVTSSAGAYYWGARGTMTAPSDGVFTLLNNAGTAGSGALNVATLIGGTTTTSTLTLQSTSGTGTNGADIVLKGGTNGGTELMHVLGGGTGIGEVGIGISPTGNAGLIQGVESRTITGIVADGLTASHTFAPTYSAATAQTVTRHNYLRFTSPVLAGAGPAALTDACAMWFDSAIGTHKAVDAATTKITVTGVDAWVKINCNGVVLFMPAYLSKTA